MKHFFQNWETRSARFRVGATCVMWGVVWLLWGLHLVFMVAPDSQALLEKQLEHSETLLRQEGMSESAAKNVAKGLKLPEETLARLSPAGQQAAARAAALGQVFADYRRKSRVRTQMDYGISAGLILIGVWLMRRPAPKTT